MTILMFTIGFIMGGAVSCLLVSSGVTALRGVLCECLDQMERTPKSAISPDFIAAINDGRKALGEQ